jgi:glycosyltransferase involved in cell wall biosynthesis
LVDIRILVDDHSSDGTVELARRLGLHVFQHDRNYSYGRNQQTCYREAWAAGADVVIMLHPDYQYTPLLITAMASMVAYEVYDVVLGSRIIGGTALSGGMPVYKYFSNRLLTAFENLFLGVKLSEYHTGYRAFSRRVLTERPLLENSDDFVFDNQMLAQCVHFGFHIGESILADEILRRGILDQLPPQCEVRPGRSRYNVAICAAEDRGSAL